jgi:pullulanase/glycogen debranching enzyme
MLRFFFNLLVLLALLPSLSIAQVIWAEPAFPTANQAVTIYFDATQGSGGLANCNCDVFLHTGLITSASNSSSDWKHVVTSWGVANNAWRMTPVSGQPNVYKYDIQPSIKTYYGVTNPTETIEKMAFVFRNGTGSLEGKDVGGADIFYDVYPDNLSFSASLISPSTPSVFAQLGQVIEVEGVSSQPATLTLTDNGTQVFATNGVSLSYDLTVASGGTHLVEFKADNGQEVVSQSFTYVVPGATTTQALPAGAELGINYLSDTEVLFALYAPGKQHVFLIGDFNQWQFDTDFQLKRTPDGTTWWIQISGLTPGQFYAFQYVVDGSIRIGDPYSNLILDPSNDGFIPAQTYPNIPPYPVGKTTGIVSLLQPGAPAYDWQVLDFQRPPQENLVVYELLMRDFLHRPDFSRLEDQLDYLAELGITAIELMPVNEFDGNLSWGYNPTYHYALDKYYGTPEKFKHFVDACHQRGIAVILDVVFNHTHEKNPLAMLYWNPSTFKPAADNPWLNVNPTHDFNVFFDFNHESQATKTYVKKTMEHWLTEYKVDGFRFDLSKGFTQKVTIGNVGAWGQYDANRIATLKDYADAVWAVSPGAYVILEHFADNAEEKELSNYGAMLWGGFDIHNNYLEAAMGYGSNLSVASYKNRGWNDAHLIAYMESHDEERMMYKNLNFGAGSTNGSYTVKDFQTALDRVELASTFFYTIPGPKMLWQFGELGFEYSINRCTNGTVSSNCRLDPKPIRWDYLDQPDRVDVYNVIRSLLYLRNNYEAFQTTDFQLNTTQHAKTIHLNHTSMNVAVLGNFNVTPSNINPDFQHTGWWYEYFSGDSLDVQNTTENLNFQPGEYRLYTDVKITAPAYFTDVSDKTELANSWSVAPNPIRESGTIRFRLDRQAPVQFSLFDVWGKLVDRGFEGELAAGHHELNLALNIAPGVYLLRMTVNGQAETKRIVVQ